MILSVWYCLIHSSFLRVIFIYLTMLVVRILPVCCCTLFNCKSFIHVHFLFVVPVWHPRCPVNEINKCLAAWNTASSKQYKFSDGSLLSFAEGVGVRVGSTICSGERERERGGGGGGGGGYSRRKLGVKLTSALLTTFSRAVSRRILLPSGLA